MDTDRARLISERLHASDREEDGTPLLQHIRRVAYEVPAEARTVAWLHEAFEWTAVAEQELLASGLTSDELRALRLLHRTHGSRSDRVYLAHLHLIARAAGPSGGLARVVKIADLEDRRVHPRVRPDGWSPPCVRSLDLLRDPFDGWRGALTTAGNGHATEARAGYGAPEAPAARSRMPWQSIKSTRRSEAI